MAYVLASPVYKGRESHLRPRLNVSELHNQ